MQLIDAHHLLPELQIPVKRGQVLVHAVDEPHVDGGRDVRAVQGLRERRIVLARLGVERHLLHFRVHRRAERPAEPAKRAEERRHHLLAIRAVRQRAQIVERGLVELHRSAVAQRDGRIREVRVREDVEGPRWPLSQRAGVGEELLFVVGERVRLAAQDVFEVDAVHLQPRLSGEEPLDRRLPCLQNLRLDVGGLRAERRSQLRHLLPHALALAVARVLVGFHARVDVEPGQFLVEGEQAVQTIGQRARRRRQPSLESSQRGQLGGEGLLGPPPRRVRRVDVREIPFERVRDLRSIALLRARNRG